MIWSSPTEFFAMGGYGVYVWGSMGITIIAVCVECFALSQRRNAALRRIQRKQGGRHEAGQ